MIELLRNLIGQPPPGFEVFEYLFCAVLVFISLLIIKGLFDILFSFFDRRGY